MKRLKQAEISYAAELAAFRSNFRRLDKYYNVLGQTRKSSEEGKEIYSVLEGIKRNRPIKPQ